jgi:hypothetical protein
MGRNFPAICVVILFNISSLLFAEDKILMPTPARPVLPPTRNREKIQQEDLQRKRENSDYKSNVSEPEVKSPSKIRDEKLLQEMIKPRPYVFQLSLSILIPKAFVRGDLDDYSLDPSNAVHMQYRLFRSKEISELQTWIGFRAANFNGTGTYKDLNGRFSFTYFGPTIGVGKISLAPRSLPAEGSKDSKEGDAFVTQTGYFWVGGVAAQSRLVTIDRGAKPPDNEMNSKGITFDSPGLWTEFIYTRVHYGALSTNYFAGVQSGNQKFIAYLGFGVGGFY